MAAWPAGTGCPPRAPAGPDRPVGRRLPGGGGEGREVLEGRRVGFALCASHHNLDTVLGWVERLVAEGADVYPIVSHSVATVATRHGTPAQWLGRLEAITGRTPWKTIPEVEPIGPKRLLDVLVIAPCTGTTLAKLASGFSDSAVLMAAKAQLRNQRPVVLAISTNDGLGLNAPNLAALLNAKNVYFVPFGQDNPDEKPNSLTSRFDLLPRTVEAALEGRQLQPLLVVPWATPEPAGGPARGGRWSGGGPGDGGPFPDGRAMP